MAVYYGRNAHDVYKNWQPLEPGRSLKLRNHSPTGFSWGYGGSGPAQLALALLLDVTDSEQVALASYQQFKWDTVATWKSSDEWLIRTEEILEWLRTKRAS